MMTTAEKLGIAAVIGGAALATIGGISWAIGRRRRLEGFGLGSPRMVGSRREQGMLLQHWSDKVMPIKQRVGLLQDLTWKSVQDPRLRKVALDITHRCPARDGECEARAVYDWVRSNIRYTGDIAPVKMGSRGKVEGVDLFQSAMRSLEFRGGDCLPAGTLLLVEGHRFVPIEQLLVGQRIWGRDDWTTIKDVWFKDVLPVDVVYLNNGSSFRATSDHKVYVAICRAHPVRWENGVSCSCPMSEREIRRLPLAEIEPGMVLIHPDRIAFGAEEMDPDRALMEGLYISDGWCSHEASFDIAGRDGHPKEAQKRTVEEICRRLGIATYWNEKYIRVKDREWTQRMAAMGHRAPEKHALSIDLAEGAAAALLRGIMADSGANTHGGGRTFTTTSRALALQVRVLHKMFGLTCSERYIVDHGGLGEHPIWRLGVRDADRSDGKAVKFLRVKAIERAVLEMPVYDLSTEDHYVYLPEADVTVSNCDDHSVLTATLLTLNGIPSRFRVTAPSRKPNAWSHIFVLAGLPKTRPTRWIAVDTTLPGDNFSREAPSAKHVDFPA